MVFQKDGHIKFRLYHVRLHEDNKNTLISLGGYSIIFLRIKYEKGSALNLKNAMSQILAGCPEQRTY